MGPDENLEILEDLPPARTVVGDEDRRHAEDGDDAHGEDDLQPEMQSAACWLWQGHGAGQSEARGWDYSRRGYG